MKTIQPEELSAAVGVMISLGCSYLPGIKEKFASLEPTTKRLVMLGLLLLTAAAVLGLSCIRPGWLPGTNCSAEGAWDMARIFIIAVIANQAAFEISPKVEVRGADVA